MSWLITNMQSNLGRLGTALQSGFNKALHPESQEKVASRIKNFAIKNPKIAAFAAAQIALTGLPLILFVTFCITAFLFSLIAALLIGLVVALLFTVFMIGVALIVVLPTVFLTTFGATFLFLFGIGGYYALKWINGGESPAAEGTAVGDKINSLMGGRMRWLTEGVRTRQEYSEDTGKETKAVSNNEKEDENGSATRDEGPKKNSNGNTSAGVRKPPKLASGSRDSAMKHTETVSNETGSAQKTNPSEAGDTESASETAKDAA